MARPATSRMFQFIAGSLDSPVSTAWMWGVMSKKHSSRWSKPDLDPNNPNQGVQTWAGMTMHWWFMSNAKAVRSLADMGKVGRPSDSSLAPALEKAVQSSATVAKSGANSNM